MQQKNVTHHNLLNKEFVTYWAEGLFQLLDQAVTPLGAG
jgi:hypothetical protein